MKFAELEFGNFSNLTKLFQGLDLIAKNQTNENRAYLDENQRVGALFEGIGLKGDMLSSAYDGHSIE